jgi:hypothetical protein
MATGNTTISAAPTAASTNTSASANANAAASAATTSGAITGYPVLFLAALDHSGPSTTSGAADDTVSTATSIFPATIDRSSTTSHN